MIRTRTVLIAALVTTALAGLAWAATVPHAGHVHAGGPAGHFMHLLEQLNLTPEQQTQVDSIIAAAKPQFQTLRASGQTALEALAVTAPTDPTYPAVLAAAKASAAAHIQQMSDVKSQVYAILTPAQQAQIPQIVAAEKAKWTARKSEWRTQHGQPGASSAE
jgi:Spy/CpxP family protein refolding chaperone